MESGCTILSVIIQILYIYSQIPFPANVMSGVYVSHAAHEPKHEYLFLEGNEYYVRYMYILFVFTIYRLCTACPRKFFS